MNTASWKSEILEHRDFQKCGESGQREITLDTQGFFDKKKIRIFRGMICGL